MKERVVALLVAAGTLAGCSSGYILSEYSTASSAKVTVRCKDRYTVYRKPDKLLVLAYPLAEIAGCGDDDAPGVTGVRYERAATASLETTPDCKLTGGRELDLLHSEFTIACPTPAGAAKPKP